VIALSERAVLRAAQFTSEGGLSVSCYVIAHVTVTNPEGYKGYTAETPGSISAYGGKFVVRGGAGSTMEGTMPGERHVVIWFPDRAAAERWYNSPEYQALIPIRQANSTGALAIVDGFDG
jgi:uncharacterized protein (DUF1330 family)